MAAWGSNSYGELGDNAMSNCRIPVAVNTAAGSALFGKSVVAISAGNNHSMALCSDGTVAVWGDNYYGQVGDGTTTPRNVPRPVISVAGSALFGKTVMAVAAGDSYSLALCSDGTVAAWGCNISGQLGDKSTTSRSLPVTVNKAWGSALQGRTVVNIAAGAGRSFALCSDGTLAAWGTNSSAQLGDNSKTNRRVPVVVSDAGLVKGETFSKLASGSAAGSHSLALASWPGMPVVIALPATTITNREATLNGTVNACGTSSAVTFEYGTTTAYGTTLPGHPGWLAETSAVAANVTLTGLLPGTQYHYRVSANGVHSIDQTFFTRNPIIDTLPVTDVTSSGAVLNGTVNAGGVTTAIAFEYGTTKYYGTTVPADPPLVDNPSATAVSSELSNLLPGTLYHFRVIGDTVPGADQTFVTGFPTLTTLTADNITACSAKLNGTVNASGGTIAVSFEYVVATDSLTTRWSTLPATPATVSGATATAVSATVGGLLPETQYLYRVTANGACGDNQSFCSQRASLSASWSNPTQSPLSFDGGDYTGSTISFTLNCDPTNRTLIVIKNNTTDPIQSRFDNLAQWQPVTLRYSGFTYHFRANYFGGDGYDLVLEQESPPTPPGAAAFVGVGQASGAQLTNGVGTIDFGEKFVGESVSQTFTIRNNGTDSLTGLMITWDGNGAADFAISSSQLAPLAPNEQTTFTTTFTPSVSGLRTAALHLFSNDPLNGNFTINLAGSGCSTSAGGSLNAVFNSPSDVPLTASSYTARGYSISLSLNCALVTNELMVIKNTGFDPIRGQFSNLQQGQLVGYDFVANYHGGTGNDLVLVRGGISVCHASALAADVPPCPKRVIAGNEGLLQGKTIMAAIPRSNGGLLLCADGTLAAWGSNSSGQLGDGTTTDSAVPVAVSTAAGSALYGKTVVAIAAGGATSSDQYFLALCSDGTVAGWGYNGYQQLGWRGGYSFHSIPVSINETIGSELSGKTVTAIAGSNQYSLMLCSDGSVVALGLYYGNTYGPLVLNTATNSALYRKTVTAIATGGLVLCSDGTVVDSGAVVDTATDPSALHGKTVTALSRGEGQNGSHCLALCSDGTVAAWGANSYGQLGDGTVSYAATPVAVNTGIGSSLFGKTVVAVSAGDGVSKALCADGTVASWGGDHLGNPQAATTLVPTILNSTLLGPNERFTSIASLGTDFMGIVSPAVMPDPPTCVTSAASNQVTQTGARLHGMVNAHGTNTTVVFEYGTDPTSFPSTVEVPWLVTSSGDMPVDALVTGLLKNTTYYFRVKATNFGGSVFGDIQSLITRTEPTVSLGTVTVLSNTSVQVSGTVNTRGSETQVIVDYGTDVANLLLSVPVTGVIPAGNANTAVSVVLDNLPQGATYYYRFRSTSLGGVGLSTVGTFQLAALSGISRIFPAAPPNAQGYVFVTLFPSSIASGWRFVGEQQWRASGVPAGGLATANRMIEFRPVPGYIQPPQETIGVVSGEAATFLERTYYQASTTGSGGLMVTLKPDALAAETVPAETRAQWRLLGEDDTKWRDSGVSLTGMPPGNYLVECKPVAGRTTPPATTASMQEGHTAAPTITYFLADAVTGTQPILVPFETVTTDQSKPYAYVGQIRSDVGSSSGFVVKPRVVATAGHVVFDDGTLAAATGLQWLFQRHQGTYEPKPQIPRGFYIFDGYAAQRSSDNTPGSSSEKSQNLDAAAMYFLEDVGRGGYGGYLASDLDNNEFILSAAQKILVGYPVDGISASNQGRMYATPPANATFAKGFGHTYTTTSIRSSGGGSGGSLCIQYQGGNYYPAAIYLGGSGQTVVRSIDSQIIDLFARAEVSSVGGTNNTGGGITHTSVSGTLDPVQPGSLQVFIEPTAARAAGAGWRLKPEATYRLSGAQKSGLSPGNYVLELPTVAGFPSPSQPEVIVTGGQLTTLTFTYGTNLAEYGNNLTSLDLWRLAKFGTTSNDGAAADTEDPDHDGQSNLSEYAAGTDPNNASDVLKVPTTARTGSTFTLTTSGKAGRTYSLQRKTDLSAGTWDTLGTRGPLAIDDPVTLTDPAAPAGKAFYRIQVAAP